MLNLLIEQTNAQGSLKKWRIHPDQTLLTFGSSKHADLRSPDQTVAGIQGVFERRGPNWIYIDLTANSDSENTSGEIEIQQSLQVSLGSSPTSALKITPFSDRDKVFAKIDQSDLTKDGSGKKPFQLFSVFHEGRLLESQILLPGKNFISRFDSAKEPWAAQPSTDWITTTRGPLSIQQRTIYLNNDHKSLARNQWRDLIDPEAKIPLFATIFGALVLTFLFLVSPENDTAADLAFSKVEPKDIQEIKTVIPKEKRKLQAPAPMTPPVSKAESSSPPSASIKTLAASSRFSQLLSKVSATAAKSVNIVSVKQGVEAGVAPSSSASQALAKVATGDKTWSGNGGSKDPSVSTLSRSGNGSLGQIGKLQKGSVGAAGSQLLEEEAEVSGGLDRDVIAEVIKSNLGQILYCYERQLSANPDLFGKVNLRFTIGSSGGVTSQSIKDSSLRNATVENCILQKVSLWRFPQPKGGTQVKVTYPFLFKSTN
jgi:TonB family protein